MEKPRELTVVVQVCGPGDQHEEEKRREAESHAEQLCRTERRTVSSYLRRHQSGLQLQVRHLFFGGKLFIYPQINFLHLSDLSAAAAAAAASWSWVQLGTNTSLHHMRGMLLPRPLGC